MALTLPAVDLYPPAAGGIDRPIGTPNTAPAAPPVPASPVALGCRIMLARSSLPDSPLSA